MLHGMMLGGSSNYAHFVCSGFAGLQRSRDTVALNEPTKAGNWPIPTSAPDGMGSSTIALQRCSDRDPIVVLGMEARINV